jgi:asparagine synthase (glutamine-hydrolysing)
MCGILCSVECPCGEAMQPAALRVLRHRGPDGEGTWASSDAAAWLGHRRLAIVDLSAAGRQPLSNEADSIHMCCNGEIYNYPELRRRLEGVGHRFRSHSDNEIILHAYEQWGDECVERLDGMFAFVLWDDGKKRLLAARDRVGIKPLYYAHCGRGIVLASELGAVLPLLGERPSLDPMALAYVMTLGYVPAPLSVWNGVHKLEPGHVLTWSKGVIQTRRYWDPPREMRVRKEGSNEDWAEIFDRVVREHLLSDVPVSLFLSGGLDSSAVAAALHEAGKYIEAITVQFPGSRLDEAPIAAQVASNLGFPHRVVPLTIDNVDELLRSVCASFDEPQGYSALLSMFLVSRAAAETYKVVLAGDGGDECFGGYSWYQGIRARAARRGFFMRKLYRRRSSGVQPKAAWHRFAARSVLHAHAWRVYPRFLPNEAAEMLAPTGLTFGDEEMLEPLRKHFVRKMPLRRALQRVDLMTFCSDSILAKVDRASMAHSLEVRVPFLDRRIVEWALSCPWDPGEEHESKLRLRRYLQGRVPEEVLNHPKQGFSLQVLDGYDWQSALERIENGPLVEGGYLVRDVRRIVENGMPYREGRIWNLLMLSCWAETWLN